MHCKICSSTHTKDTMLICERCGCGYHINCLPYDIKGIPEDAWYCKECLKVNRTMKVKDITMDFDCIKYLKK